MAYIKRICQMRDEQYGVKLPFSITAFVMADMVLKKAMNRCGASFEEPRSEPSSLNGKGYSHEGR